MLVPCLWLLAAGSLQPELWLILLLDTGYSILDDILAGPQMQTIESIEHPASSIMACQLPMA